MSLAKTFKDLCCDSLVIAAQCNSNVFSFLIKILGNMLYVNKCNEEVPSGFYILGNKINYYFFNSFCNAKLHKLQHFSTVITE